MAQVEQSANLTAERSAPPATAPAAPDRHFSTEHLQGDLKGHSVRGGAATVATQAARFLVKFASVPVLARLLTPEDYGLIAMVAAVTGFVSMFKDAGLSQATVQRAEINHAQVSTLFWINVLLGTSVMLAVMALAPGIAWFYGEPRLTWIALALAASFLLSGLTIQHSAMLRRQMRFGTIGTITIVSNVLAVAVGISAAVAGAGYWALVLMMLAESLASAVLTWSASGWRPALPRRRTGVRPMLAFGLNLTGSDFLTYVRRNGDNVLLGAFWGAGPLGLYSKAYSLLLLPLRQINAPLNAVAFPALSRLQRQPERFRRYYSKGVEMAVVAGMPLVAFASVAVEQIIRVVLGEQWMGAAPIFRAVVPAALLGTFNMAGAWVMVPCGRTDKHFRVSLWSTVAAVAGFCAGLPWGAWGVALSFSVSSALLYPPTLLYAFHGSPVRMSDLVRALWRPAMASAVAAAVLLALAAAGTKTGVPLVDLAAGGLLFAGLYLAVYAVLPGGRTFLFETASLVRNLRLGVGSRQGQPGGL